MAPRINSTVLHVARADFLQRVRSRRLVVLLVIVAYVGYELNVGSFELLYQDTVDGQTIDYRGEPTAAYVGLTTGVTGATILFLFGYYVLAGSLERDRSIGVDRLIASTPIDDRAYLLGKWLSHVGLVVLVLVTLAGAALVNHAVHGVGRTDPLWIVGATVFVGLPVGCFVAGVTLLFQSTRRLRGTLGNVLYVFGALTLLSAVVAAAFDRSDESIALWLRMADSIGLFAAGEMTFDALLAVAPEYDGPRIANYGAGATDGAVVTYEWDGGSWPGWFYANRLGLVLTGAVLAIAAAVPYERFSSDAGSDSGGRFSLGRFVPSWLSRRTEADSETAAEPETPVPTDVSLTPVETSERGGFGRLLFQELRLLVRGHPWWWYAGAVIVAAVGLTGDGSHALVAIAAIWPLFVWSAMGYRVTHHRITPFIVTSRRPYGQLLAEWTAGALLAMAFFGVALWPTLLEAGAGGLVVFVGAVVFVPSLAQFLGLWSGTGRTFELVYLVVWYIGPLNGVPALDFAGATGETVGTVTPQVFGAVGLLALLGALAHRWLQV